MAVVWKKLAFEDDVVLEALFDADTFLYATDDNVPVATSPADVMAALSGHAGAEFLFNTQKIGGVVDPTTAQQVATKNYVDNQIGGVNEFTELTDTPAAYAGEGGKLVVVNATPDALEFVAITTFLEGVPTEDLATKAPTSEWAFDLETAYDAHVLVKAANATLGHVIVEAASLIDVDGDGKLTLGTHKDTHDPEDGSDAIDAAAPNALLEVQAQAEGTSHSLARADHDHAVVHDITDNALATIDGSPADTEVAIWTTDGLNGETPASLAARMALDDIGVPDAPVDFDLQQAKDLVVMYVADAATRAALAAAATEVGQLIWQEDTGELYACTESSV